MSGIVQGTYKLWTQIIALINQNRRLRIVGEAHLLVNQAIGSGQQAIAGRMNYEGKLTFY
jgi:hypothetical protein